jgi:hypothetical protein
MNIKKLDGSFNIIVNNLPYNTIKGDKYYQQTLDLYNSNPELFENEKKTEKSLEELKQDKIEELKKEREVYKSNTFIRDGYSLLDFEPFTCYNYHNLVRLKCGWKQEDLDKFDVENEFISKFWDTKKAEINNATTKTKLKNINTKFVKE